MCMYLYSLEMDIFLFPSFFPLATLSENDQF